jgi:hypothetical protein
MLIQLGPGRKQDIIPLIAHGHRTEPKKNNSNGNLKVDERKDIYRISVKVAIENSL